MHQIAGCRGAINSLLVEVVEDHIRTQESGGARRRGGGATDRGRSQVFQMTVRAMQEG
jgi:hypothetical protein